MALDPQQVIAEANRVAIDVASRNNLQFTPTMGAEPLSVPKSTSTLSFPQTQPQVNDSQSILAGIQSTLNSWTDQLKSAQSQQDTKPQALQQAEQEQTGLFSKIKEASSKLLGIGERKTQLESEAGIDENTKKLQENQMAMASKMAEYEQAVKQIDGLNVAKPFQDIERNRAARTYASEVGVLEAYGNALRGNLELAQNRIEQVLQNEFQATQQEVDNLKTFYEINSDILSGEEKKYAEQINAQAQAQEAELKARQTDAKNNTDLFMEVAKNGGSANVIDFSLSYEENLQRAAPYIGALDRAREARLGRETSVGESTFTEVILESLNNGATPEQAAQEAAMRSELLGIQVDQKTLSSWIKQAKEMKTLKDEETIQTEQTIEEPEIEKEIRELSVRGVFNNADIRSALISRGYTQKEINQSSVASAVGKISDFGSSFFVNLFGD